MFSCVEYHAYNHFIELFFHCCILLHMLPQWPNVTRATLTCVMINMIMELLEAQSVWGQHPDRETCRGTCAAYKQMSFSRFRINIATAPYLSLHACYHAQNIIIWMYPQQLTGWCETCTVASSDLLQSLLASKLGGTLSLPAPVASLLFTWTVWRWWISSFTPSWMMQLTSEIHVCMLQAHLQKDEQ